MKHYIAIGLLALACGAAEEQDTPDLDTAGDEIELGTAEQALKVGTGSGFSSASSHLACTFPGGSGQDCRINVPNTLTIGYCFSGLSTTEKNELKVGINIVDAGSNWTFTETSAPCPLFIQKGAVSGSTTRIDHYVSFSPGGTITNLTSPAGAGHLNGTWKAFTSGSAVVDADKAFNQGAANRPDYMAHMGGRVAQLHLGQGSVDNDTAYAHSPTRRNMLSAFTPITGLTSGDTCRLNAINNAAPANQVSALTTCGL